MNTPLLRLFAPTEYGPNLNTSFPITTPYDTYLRKKGFIYPAKPERHSNQYINVWGRKAYASLAKPFALVIYTPKVSEKHYQTYQRAIIDAPPKGDWQVIHLFTGQIIYEPPMWRQSNGYVNHARKRFTQFHTC